MRRTVFMPPVVRWRERRAGMPAVAWRRQRLSEREQSAPQVRIGETYLSVGFFRSSMTYNP